MACLDEGVEVGYQASQSQTAEVRVSLRRHNPVYECHTNRQAAHGRPKSLILPEALMFNQSQEGTQQLQYISTNSNPVLRLPKLSKSLGFNLACVINLKRSLWFLVVVILHVIACVSVFLLLEPITKKVIPTDISLCHHHYSCGVDLLFFHI